MWPTALACLCLGLLVVIDCFFIAALPRWLFYGLPRVPQLGSLPHAPAEAASAADESTTTASTADGVDGVDESTTDASSAVACADEAAPSDVESAGARRPPPIHLHSSSRTAADGEPQTLSAAVATLRRRSSFEDRIALERIESEISFPAPKWAVDVARALPSISPKASPKSSPAHTPAPSPKNSTSLSAAELAAIVEEPERPSPRLGLVIDGDAPIGLTPEELVLLTSLRQQHGLDQPGTVVDERI